MRILEQKVAVVTGSARGLGTQVALAFARAGADVVIADLMTEPLQDLKAQIEALGQKALPLRMDVSDEASVQACAQQTLAEFGRVDILANVAGITGPSAPLWQIELKDWKQTLDVNTTGVFLCCKAFLPAMIERRSGSIIIIGSMTGKRPLLNRTPYAVSKIALVGLARTLAWEVGPYNIRVNVISPGPMEGERLKWIFETQAKEQGITVEEARERMKANSPLHRFIPPEEVAATAVFLCSDWANSITGEDVNVSAGIAMY
jgi:NAD(P)-dependent dehydrogenase (short-subunit alcohol dehydrogenase family)